MRWSDRGGVWILAADLHHYLALAWADGRWDAARSAGTADPPTLEAAKAAAEAAVWAQAADGLVGR